MIKIENFDMLESSGISYGGHGGSKKGIIYNNERWFLKYPKSTKSMDVESLSYTTTPISEYIGSHIYETIEIETHDTKLGIANNKVVVACKDFLKSNEIILDYNSIKNEYSEVVERELEKISSSKSDFDNDISELKLIIDKNSYFRLKPELKERFWDMFIIDAFINNNDRNEGNWGLILDKDTKDLKIAPVYDNGASFYNKSNDYKLNDYLNDEFKFKQVVYDSCISIFSMNDKPINPLKYIENMDDIDCNNAILRIVPKINLNEIKKIFDEIPEEYNGLKVFSKIQKEFYFKTLEYKYNNILLPIYNQLKN